MSQCVGSQNYKHFNSQHLWGLLQTMCMKTAHQTTALTSFFPSNQIHSTPFMAPCGEKIYAPSQPPMDKKWFCFCGFSS